MGSSPQWDLPFLIFLLGAVMISGTRTCNSWDAISDMESPTISRGTGAIYSCDEIVLMGAPLGDSGAAILAKMISGTTHVKTLSLSYVSMSAAGAVLAVEGPATVPKRLSRSTFRPLPPPAARFPTPFSRSCCR